MIQRFKSFLPLAILLLPFSLVAQDNDLSMRVLAGIKQSQAKYTNVCGTVTETRTSKLMTKPLVLRGRFCSAQPDRFMIDYAEPTDMHLRFSDNYLNITTNGKTEVMNIGSEVRRGESIWSGDNSTDNMKKNFALTTTETSREFEMKLVPRTQTFRRSLNYLVVKFNKQDFLPRSIEVDGKSGVNSVFLFEVTSVNKTLPEDTFKVAKTQ